MRAVIQRVSEASVMINGSMKASIAHGMLVLTGISNEDDQDDVDWLSRKVAQLRIFDDGRGAMNRALAETNGEILLISQFTLLASTKKGNRPSFVRAARPETAVPLYNAMIIRLQQELGKPVATGSFGADMKVSLVNDGPVTIIIDSRNRE